MTVKDLRLFLACFDENDTVAVSDSVFDISHNIADAILVRSLKNDIRTCVLIPFKTNAKTRSVFSFGSSGVNDGEAV